MSAKPTVYKNVNNNMYQETSQLFIAALDKLLIKHMLKIREKRFLI